MDTRKVRIYTDVEQSIFPALEKLCLFWGLDGCSRIEDSGGHREEDILLYAGVGNRDVILNFSRVINLSGLPVGQQIVRLEDPIIRYCDHESFDHRRIRREKVSGCISPAIMSTRSGIKVIVKTEKGIPLLFQEHHRDRHVVCATVNAFDSDSALDIRRMDRIDWLWHSIELVGGFRLRHRKWLNKFSWRFDDVIGDAGFNFLKPMGRMAGYSLLAVDLNELHRERFFKELLPLCGEVCVHAHTHYKYTDPDRTVLTYMNWESGDLSAVELDSRLKDMDEFLNTIPRSKISPVISPHGFQIGANAEQKLVDRGIKYVITPFVPGEPFTAKPHNRADLLPYSNVNYHLTPRDSGLCLFYNLPIKSDHCRWGSPSRYELKVRESSTTDFLYGLKMFEPPNRYLNPVDLITARIGVLREKAAVAGFPLTLFTHETALNYLGREAWADVCKAVDEDLLAGYECCKMSSILSKMHNNQYVSGKSRIDFIDSLKD